MKLSEISITRPVFATVMSLVIVIFGVIAFTRLPVREYPDIDPPIVTITTLYRGASASVVETEITDVIEESLSTLEGVKTIQSSSREQGSSITVEFELSRDVEEAANDVRDRVSRIGGRLPREAEDPIVAKVDTNAQPIIWLALLTDRHTTLELSEFADVVLKERLQRLPGVGSVFIGGERRYAMRIWLDPQRMASRDLTVQDVENAVRRENAEIPGGRVEGSEREFSVRTRGELSTPEEFGAIIVSQKQDNPVRLSDIAEVTVGAEDERTITRFNGSPAIGLGIVKQTASSTVEVADEVNAALPRLRGLLPEGMQITTAYDSSIFIRDSIREVAITILFAVGLVLIVVLAFLKSWRATLLPALAIPISIIGAFAVMYFLGFTINILTLLAFVLAIGLVVDDAIVMLENCFRHLEMGKPRMQAAWDGAREVGFAIVATTVALVAVFLPLAFLTGTVGQLFKEFGISLAVAVIISSFVALTLTPMLCSKILKSLHGRSSSFAERSFDSFFAWLDRSYEATLRFVLHHRLPVFGLAFLLFVGSLFLFRGIPSELVPIEDRSIAFGIVLAPEGATLEYTDRYMRQLEEVLLQRPEHEGLFTATGLGFGGPGRVTNGFVFFRMKPRAEREKSQQQVVQELFGQTFAIPGVLAFLINPPSLGGRFSSSPVDYVLLGESYEELQQATSTMMAKGSELGYLINLDSDLRLNKPELDIQIDRDRAARLGVSVTDIGSTLETLLGGRVVSGFKRGSNQYDVVAQMRPQERSTPETIEAVYLRSGSGTLVQLANVVRVSETVAPKELNHYNRQRSTTLTANLAPGVDLGTALNDLDRIAAESLAAGIRTDLAGQSREFRESSSKLYFMFLLAIVFIYLVLAAQFESFVHPLTILLSVPLAVVGAIVSLRLFNLSLNIYSQIGLVILIGLVTKNSILIVEFSNQLRQRGANALDAVIQAARIRLRPILMTSFSTIVGVLPIALGRGSGAEARQPLGIAIVGGMFFSTFLTLLLVPAVYIFMARFTRVRDRAKEIEAIEQREAAPVSTPLNSAAAQQA
jgi:multidrug efflux pump